MKAKVRTRSDMVTKSGIMSLSLRNSEEVGHMLVT